MPIKTRKPQQNEVIFKAKDLVDEKQFKPFNETYKIITFALIVGLIYPNPATERWRVILFVLQMLSVAPLAGMVFLDMYKCWLARDFVNLIRHSTISGPFVGSFLKILLMNVNPIKSKAKAILDEMNRDYAKFNTLPEQHKVIAEAEKQNCLKYSEWYWLITVVSVVMTFPMMAIILNIYSFTFESEPTKYMIHDMNKPFSEPEDRFKSPFFEFIFVYNFYCAIIYIINFTGFDGYYGLMINHACLKTKIYCKALEDAFLLEDESEIARQVADVVEEQCRFYRFVDLIQDIVNIWLGVIFISTVIQICCCLYHVIEGYGFDVRYMIFIAGTIIHIYLWCRYAAKIEGQSIESAIAIYSSGWEQVNCNGIRKMVVFMIARAQIPTEIKAFKMLTFNMDLFVSILQSSYSMFTILRS